MIINKLKEETNEFLVKFVFPYTKFSNITSENADNIVDFIEQTYVIPLINDKEENLKIDESLLKMAEAAVDDICEN